MLVEVSCDKFIDDGMSRKPILFNQGLNVVLGDETGSNSIGKSTLLLVIDYVFGGDDYLLKALDVHEHVGRHQVKAVFEFQGEKFFFLRDTGNPRQIVKLDADGHKTEELSIVAYRNFLKEKYGITQPDLSFRDVVSRYLRIYQRENLDEKHPLSLFREEAAKEAVHVLMRLFGVYAELQELSDSLEAAKERYADYQNAVKQEFIPIISSKREYREKECRLESLRHSQEEFDDPEQLKNKSAEELVRIAEIRNKLQVLRAQKSRAETKLAKINANLGCDQIDFGEDFSELKEFFPSIDIRKVEEIESFHRKLSEILKEELDAERNATLEHVQKLDDQIKASEDSLATMDVPSGISTRILRSYADNENEIRTIEQQKKNYDLKVELKDDCDSLKQQLENREQGIRDKLQQDVSAMMKEKNDFIYDGKKKPPYLVLEKNNYRFVTPDDTGTGTAYKSLIVYDLAVLTLTNLPILVHDSILLKNIADAPIEKILQLYQQSGKQIFIALDKASSYSDEAKRIMCEASVIKLSSGGHSLFGWSWGDVQNNPQDVNG